MKSRTKLSSKSSISTRTHRTKAPGGGKIASNSPDNRSRDAEPDNQAGPQSETPTPPMKIGRGKRIDYLDIAKAICIVLVVIGHFNPLPAPEGWRTLVSVIYSFHMPLFMFVSGFLFSKTYRQQPYLSFISKKIRHLMVPYFLTSVLIIGIKLTMQSILPVKNTATAQDLLTMFYKPSAAIHLWFIWALMLLYLIAPLCRKKYAGIGFLAGTLTLWLLPVNFPDIFALNQFKTNAVFFATGMLSHNSDCSPCLKKVLYPIIIVLFAILEYMYACGVCTPVLKKVLPFIGIMFILTISRLLSEALHGKARSLILFLGANSLIIFLFHSAFGEFGKAALSLAGITSENHFALALLTYVLLGICGPLLLKKSILSVSARLRIRHMTHQQTSRARSRGENISSE